MYAEQKFVRQVSENGSRVSERKIHCGFAVQISHPLLQKIFLLTAFLLFAKGVFYL